MATMLSSSMLRMSRPCAAPVSRRPTVQVQAVGKGDLVDKLAARLEISKADATKSVESLIQIITDEVKSGERVTLVGFGTWNLRDRAARNGRNPKTGEPLKIEACKAPVFTASKVFKDLVNGKVQPAKEVKAKPAPKPKAEAKPKAASAPKASTPAAPKAAPKKASK